MMKALLIILFCWPVLFLTASDKPNVVWITSEDNSVFWMGCYGNPYANTPNIDGFAKEGFMYKNCYSNAPVCAPSRSTLITGINAVTMGTHHMRSRYDIPHKQISYYPDLLRERGYFTANSAKTDYNIGGRDDKECWDNKCLKDINWQVLKKNQPFFQVINILESHESRAHGEIENTNHFPDQLELRSYHPDLPEIRKNYAKYYDAVERMDSIVGDILDNIEEEGLAKNTIVIYMSDHGGVMARSKRFLFESGIHCPLIIRIPPKYREMWPAEYPGSTIHRIVSFVDMPKTWLSITGSDIPENMQGLIFLGQDREAERKYHFAYRGRMDERYDNARAVYSERFIYIRNYMPYVPWLQKLEYLWRQKAIGAWETHVDAGKSSAMQASYFYPKMYSEELYDRMKDPDNVNNLVEEAKYQDIIIEMRDELKNWQMKSFDAGLLPESEMVKRAHDHSVTIYELVRNPELYDLSALLDAADLALKKDPEHLPELRKLLENPDAGLRYWGMIGCFFLGDKESGYAGIHDPSHEVRAMAAWLLINSGEVQIGLNCLRDMVLGKSYATLKVLNILDWIGNETISILPEIEEVEFEKRLDGMKYYDSYETQMQNLLRNKSFIRP